MGFEEITIGKINSPDVFYFVPVHENYDVYKKQVREMNEFFNLKEERSVRICSISFHRIKYSSVCFFYINPPSGMAEPGGPPPPPPRLSDLAPSLHLISIDCPHM